MRLWCRCIRIIWLCMLLLAFGGEATELRGSSSSSTIEKHEQPQIYVHPRSRRERFPSVEERVQIYMSNWYSPPCKDDHRYLFDVNEYAVHVSNTNMTIRPHITADMLLWLKEEIVRDCARTKEEIENDRENNIALPTEQFVDPRTRNNMFIYCNDVVELFEILHHLPESSTTTTPIFMQFGDMKHSHEFGYVEIPHFRKFRSATDNLQSVISSKCVDNPRPILPTAHHDNILQPIIWKLATHRHFRYLPMVAQEDTPWHLKKNMAIFRGQLTGALDNFDRSKSAQENCDHMLRCQLVQKHGNSTLIDAKLTTTRGRLPDVIGGVEMVSPKVTISYMMEYKGIIMLEGNDVASGLKWALLSQSVVLMSKPTHTSWAMEELLEPWVHYITLNDKATDMEEKMQWVIDNDKEEAWKIAE